jgi:hypothetical protein
MFESSSDYASKVHLPSAPSPLPPTIHPLFSLITTVKVILIESNAKSRYLKKLTCKGTLRQVFYLSEAPSRPMTGYSCPTYTLYTCMQYTYSHREEEGGIANQKQS